eukprot:15562995-Heterocapsa_arctica.AAC.1
MYISELREKITPFVLKDTPAVLSIGERTMLKGYSFHWPAGKNPYFVTPSGEYVELEVIDNIPHLRRGALMCQPIRIKDNKRVSPLRSLLATPAAE